LPERKSAGERENLPDRDAGRRRRPTAEREAGDVTDQMWNCSAEKFQREREGGSVGGEIIFQLSLQPIFKQKKKN
jgi:hypothetical protein